MVALSPSVSDELKACKRGSRNLGYAILPLNQGRVAAMKIYYAKCMIVLAFEFPLVSEGNAPPSARRKTISPRQIHEAWKIFRQQRAVERLSASRYIFPRLRSLERLKPSILYITLSDESLSNVSAPSFRTSSVAARYRNR